MQAGALRSPQTVRELVVDEASRREVGGYVTRVHEATPGRCPCQAAPDPHCPMQVWCRCVTAIFNYFVVTNFFWMFVEGCYLHTAIVMTYSTERLRKWLFLFIGWCEGPWGPRGLVGRGHC